MAFPVPKHEPMPKPKPKLKLKPKHKFLRSNVHHWCFCKRILTLTTWPSSQRSHVVKLAIPAQAKTSILRKLRIKAVELPV